MRVSWIDSWKGILIASVVLGHVVGGASHYASGDVKNWLDVVYKVVYSFHMPAFFCVAGLLWKTRECPYRAFLKKKAKRILVPYFVFGVVSVLIYEMASGVLGEVFSGASASVYGIKGREPFWQPFVSLLHAGGWPRGNGFQANSVLWFLPCMFTVLIVYDLLEHLICNRYVQLVLCLPLVLSGILLRRMGCDGLPWGLSLTPYYLSFFIIGRCIDWRRLAGCVMSTGCGWSVCVIATVVHVALCLALPNRWYGDWWLGWRAVFSLLALYGIACSAFWAVLLSKSAFLCLLGSLSLGVMLVHKIVLLGLQFACRPVGRGYASSWPIAFLTVILVVCFCLAVSVIVGVGLRRWTPWMIGEGKRK